MILGPVMLSQGACPRRNTPALTEAPSLLKGVSAKVVKVECDSLKQLCSHR